MNQSMVLCEQLIDRLSESIEPRTDPEYVAAWEAEIQARIGQVERGEVKLIPWREAIEMIGPAGENGKQTT
jgi:hypothetical protein